MAGGVVTSRLIIVVQAASYRLVNDTLLLVEPTATSDPISMPLRVAGDLTNTVVAYYGNWGLDNADRASLNAAVRDAGWSPRPSNTERTVYTTAASIPALETQRVFLIDGLAVMADEVRQAMGLATLYEPRV